jgi:hypothetical protein
MSSRDGIGRLQQNDSAQTTGIVRGKDVRVLVTCLLIRARLSADFSAEQVDFLDDELLHAIARLLRLESEIKFGRADGFIGQVVPDGEVRVLEGLLAGDTLRGIEVKHLGKQVESKRVRLRKELLERHARFDWEGANIVLRLYTRQGTAVRMQCSGPTRGEPTRRRVSSEGVPR